MIISIVIIALIVIGGYIFVSQPQFGKISSDERLEKIKKSPNYKEGKFQNLSPTSDLSEGATFFKV
ncbi:MAG: MBL fold metallo-hydrolase, partial [Pyrinomonadaceae bacterium]|nr:MBL fold metallo-hydrolase [Sphingobacteriaceae bacterium]